MMAASILSIQSIEIYQSTISLKEPFIISLGRLDAAENIIVIINTENGIKGFGECSPFLTINGENAETCLIVGKLLASQLIGKNPLDVDGASALMDKIIYGNSSIKSAFEIALFDIASQHAGLPLYQFLGGSTLKTLITDYTVSLGSAAKMADDALKIKERGFQYIKVKLGETKEKDIERIMNIREAVGDIPLRIDANQGWDVSSSIEILTALKNVNVQFCEEPLPRWNFMELPQVKKQSSIPIMADESCCDHYDAMQLLKLDACSLFNIKTGKSGMVKALKIIRHAEVNNIYMQAGGFLESRLGFTAAAHLALASTNIIYYDFDTPLMFSEDPVTGGITYNSDWSVSVPLTAGLGASIAPSILKKMKGITVS